MDARPRSTAPPRARKASRATTKPKPASRPKKETEFQELQRLTRSGAKKVGAAFKFLTKKGEGPTGLQKAKRRLRAHKVSKVKQENLNTALMKEPMPVANFARKAMKRGIKPSAAIKRGRTLHEQGRLDDDGTLLRRGVPS